MFPVPSVFFLCPGDRCSETVSLVPHSFFSFLDLPAPFFLASPLELWFPCRSRPRSVGRGPPSERCPSFPLWIPFFAVAREISIRRFISIFCFPPGFSVAFDSLSSFYSASAFMVHLAMILSLGRSRPPIVTIWHASFSPPSLFLVVTANEPLPFIEMVQPLVSADFFSCFPLASCPSRSRGLENRPPYNHPPVSVLRRICTPFVFPALFFSLSCSRELGRMRPPRQKRTELDIKFCPVQPRLFSYFPCALRGSLCSAFCQGLPIDKRFFFPSIEITRFFHSLFFSLLVCIARP